MVNLVTYGDVELESHIEELSLDSHVEVIINQDEDEADDGYVSLGIVGQERVDDACFPMIYVRLGQNELVDLAKAIIKLYGDE